MAADQCMICGKSDFTMQDRINYLVLGDMWFEYCNGCADTPFLQREAGGKIYTPREVAELYADKE